MPDIKIAVVGKRNVHRELEIWVICYLFLFPRFKKNNVKRKNVIFVLVVNPSGDIPKMGVTKVVYCPAMSSVVIIVDQHHISLSQRSFKEAWIKLHTGDNKLTCNSIHTEEELKGHINHFRNLEKKYLQSVSFLILS